jgi:predicted aspartyl protease
MRKLLYSVIILCIVTIIPGSKVYAQTTVSFTYAESLLFVKAKINNSKASYTFLLNTGANATVIDKKVANALKLPIQSEKDEVLGTAGSEHIEIRKANSIAIGTAAVKNLQITSRDINNIMSNGQKIDGILGTDFLEKFCYTIDFQARKITFAGNKMEPGKQRCIPFEMANGIPRISARINDNYQTYLNYNSGVSMPYSKNSYVNVSSKQWEEIKKVNPYMGQSNTMSGKGVGGDLQMQSLKVSSIKLNETNVQNPYVVIQAKEGYFKNDDAIGFFSNSTLEKYPKATIDFIGQNIILYDYQKPAKKAVAKKPVIAQR